MFMLPASQDSNQSPKLLHGTFRFSLMGRVLKILVIRFIGLMLNYLAMSKIWRHLFGFHPQLYNNNIIQTDVTNAVSL